MKKIILYFVKFPDKPDEKAQAEFADHIKKARELGANLRDANAYVPGSKLSTFHEAVGPDVPEGVAEQAQEWETVRTENPGTSVEDLEGMTATELKEFLDERDIPFAGNASTEVLLEAAKSSIG